MGLSRAFRSRLTLLGLSSAGEDERILSGSWLDRTEIGLELCVCVVVVAGGERCLRTKRLSFPVTLERVICWDEDTT